ncbi:helix-turn-helix domain-containing protein [Nocardia transvalensis]|uniref:helix-turn-helix domain-containing protein n=1 Tax=Nocardia transvalensis TaxID=37333 RepID=UPI001895E9A4|nr:helix-turn-helix transcriptional regulator [Nocardia transvalensis]MBF6333597.1 helix-turn-helix transcriptional regulator [Nocardia transvalensis]
MPETDDIELGRKIAHFRTRKGLSQRELAPLINRSEAWLSQVERGVRKVPRLDVLERIAEVLDVPLAEFAPTAPAVAAEEVPPDAIPLRLLLSANYALRALTGSRGHANLDSLGRDADRAWTLTHESRYDELVPLLERLLPQLEAAATVEQSGPEVYAILARSYHACAAALAKMQQFDAAWVAADRAISNAGRARDPLLMGEGAFRLTLVFQGAQQLDQADHTASTARTALEGLVTEGVPEALSVYGALTLQQAIIAARTDRASDARRHLDDAQAVATRLGGDRNDYHTEFGPTNVQLHNVAVAVELGDAGEAIRIAGAIDASTLSAERRGRLLIDVARAWAQRRNVAQALSALEEAERLTPEQVRHHRLAHACIRDLLRIGRQPPPGLAELAGRAGIET